MNYINAIERFINSPQRDGDAKITPMEEKLQLRVHGDDSLPTLIYLPGLHGDWTLVGGFLQALDGRVRFVEITYPRTLVWSLEDYAAAIETALAQNGIASGWLLGESFGSQPDRKSTRLNSSHL